MLTITYQIIKIRCRGRLAAPGRCLNLPFVTNASVVTVSIISITVIITNIVIFIIFIIIVVIFFIIDHLGVAQQRIVSR